jgi:Zn-dependent protease
MRGSLKLFTLFRIPVHIHWSFGLIFMYALWIAFSNNFGIIDTAWLLGFFIALFGCVLLHEYGHILTARRYGIHTQDIILTPIGGIARLERMPEKPFQEFVVAIAGPMVNVAIAGFLFLLGYLLFQNERWELFKWFLSERLNIFGEPDEMDSVILDSGLDPSGLLLYLPVLLTANIILVVFNLIPAFPMDGGRIVRALLAMRIGRSKATNIAALIGQGFAVLFILYGLYNPESWSLTLIGFFVFVTARSENAMVQLDDLLRRFKARDIVRPQFTRLLSTDWMQTPIGLLDQGLERHFLVFDFDGKLAGFLEEDDIQMARKKRDLSSEVSRYAQKDVEVVHPNESLQYVYFLIRQKGNGIVGIADDSGLIGVIDEAGLSYFLKSQAGRK